MSQDPREYNTEGYRKHKEPDGWGSPCPKDLDEDPQTLLDTGIPVDDEIYNVSGKYALCANTHLPGRWHGYLIPWSRLPKEAKNRLIDSGRLDDATFRKALRKNWGRGFDK